MYSIIKIKKNKGLSRTKRGFSLVEVLIYASLLIIITFFITQSTLIIAKSHSKISLNRDTEYSTESAMNKIIAEIKKASSINLGTSSLNTSPGTLSLNGTESGTIYTITFSVQNGIIVFSKNSGTNTPLTSSNLQTDTLIFRLATTTNSSAIKVDMSISGTKGPYSKTLTTEDFAILRGSY